LAISNWSSHTKLKI